MPSTVQNVQIKASLQGQVSPAAGAGTLSGSLFVSDSTSFTPGSGSAAGSADGEYTVAGSVVSGTPVTINFASVTDAVGAALTVGHIVALKITNTSAHGAGTLSHGGGSNPIYSAQPLAIAPGDTFLHTFNDAGLAVTGGSSQNLQLTSSTGTVTYTVTAIVRSA